MNLILEFDPCLFSPLPELCGQRKTLGCVLVEGMFRRDRVDHHQFGAMVFAECERVLESTLRGLREVDRCENAREMSHDAALQRALVRCRRTTHHLEGNKGTINATPGIEFDNLVYYQWVT